MIVWNSFTGELMNEVRMDGENIGAVAFSPDGNHLVAGSHEGNVCFFTLSEVTDPRLSWDRRGRITALAFTPDGKTLAWSSYDGWSAHLLNWDSEWGETVLYQKGSGQLFTLRISPDGRTVAMAGSGPEILLHDIATSANPVRLPHGDRQAVQCLAFSPDGRTLAAALSASVQLWDMETHALLDEWKDHDDVVTGVTISPDGSRLLTCSWDHTARLYEFDLVGGKRGPLVGCYDWNIGRLFDVAISPDSTLAIAGGDEGDYLVAWDVE